MYERKICLTFCPCRGYLFVLFQSRGMRTNDTLQLSTELSEETELTSVASASLGQRLRSMAGSTRTKILAAMLAAAGAVESANKAEAGTIHAAEVVHTSEATEIGDDEFGIGWNVGQLRIDNLEDQSNRDMHWIGFRSMDETVVDAALSAPGHAPVPDQIIGPNGVPGDEIVSSEMILDGQLQVQENFFTIVGAREGEDPSGIAVNAYLEGSEVYVGMSPIEGNAQNIADAIAMTNGKVYQALIPHHLEANTGYVIRPTHTPEPSTLLLAGLGAGALAGTRLLRRREQAK